MLKPWSGEWVFKNIFHQAMPWRAENAPGLPDPRPLDLDEHGWIRKLEPGQWGAVRFFLGDNLRFPSGIYTVSWEGRGTVDFQPVRVVGRQPQGAMIQVDGNAGTFPLYVTSTDPRDPVRNIKVLMPGGSCANDDHQWCTDASACSGGAACVPFALTEAQQPFHPTFLKTMEPYSTLRFMFWNETIGTRVSKWSERVTPGTGLYSAFGAPYETMIQLSNHLRTDMWITIPHLADDDFVEQLAKLVKAQLDPDLTIYLEYSNEVWNGAFPMAADVRDRGLAAKLSTDPWQAQMRQYSRRSVQVFDIWTKVFEGNPRVVRVMAGQNDGYSAAEIAMTFEDAYKKVDALAIAPYFGGAAGWPDAYPKVKGQTPEQLLDGVERLLMPGAIDGIKFHAKLAADLSTKKGKTIELIAYEGGQHLATVGFVQDDESINQLFRRANRHPKMRTLYLDYLANWRKLGGRLFMHYNNTNWPSKWGCFGAVETPLETRQQSVKLDALLTFIEQNPKWW